MSLPDPCPEKGCNHQRPHGCTAVTNSSIADALRDAMPVEQRPLNLAGCAGCAGCVCVCCIHPSKRYTALLTTSQTFVFCSTSTKMYAASGPAGFRVSQMMHSLSACSSPHLLGPIFPYISRFLPLRRGKPIVLNFLC